MLFRHTSETVNTMGIRTWDQDVSRLEQQMLMAFPFQMKSKIDESGNGSKRNKPAFNKKSKKLWFCSAYQKGECTYSDKHMVDVNGKQMNAHHICASCWVTDKVKASHPDTSPSCPHYEH